MTEGTVFMVMPFGDAIADACYTHSTKPVVERNSLRIIRADEIFSTNTIFDDIVTAVEQAHIVIVDITGRNPNCFYELGMAHTLKRSRTIMITRDAYDTLPFDIAHFRIIKYENSIEGAALYENNLQQTLKAILSGLGQLYHDEFDIVIKTVTSSGNLCAVYALMGLAKINRQLKAGQPVEVEGHRQDKRNAQRSHSNTLEHGLRPLISLGYTTVAGDLVSVTPKGQAFVGFLEQQDYVVDKMNGEVLTEGYESFFDRKRRESQPPPEDVS